MVTNDLGEVLAPNPLAVALIGDETRFAPDDPGRSRFHRWFTDPAERVLHAPEEHERLSRSYVAAVRIATARHPDDTRGRALVADSRPLIKLAKRSRRVWLLPETSLWKRRRTHARAVIRQGRCR